MTKFVSPLRREKTKQVVIWFWPVNDLAENNEDAQNVQKVLYIILILFYGLPI